MKRKKIQKIQQTKPVADTAFVPVEVIVDDAVCRVELSPASFRRYTREAQRRGVTVADLLYAAASSVLTDRGPLN